MRSSSTRLRASALAASTIALLFALSGTAFAGDNGQGADHRSGNAGGPSRTAPITATEDTDSAATDEPGTGQTSNNVADEGDNQHPSGNDRSVENGGSGNQGASQSDPDGNANGGPDKPGMVGGADLNDQDGNNGCGNDDDFEDDNNGNCGPKTRGTIPPPPDVDGTVKTCPEGQTLPAGGTAPQDCKIPEVKLSNGIIVTPVVLDSLGAQVETPAPDVLASTSTDVPAQVLGVVIERPATGGTAVLGATVTRSAPLARTGFGMTAVVLVGLALLLAGFGLKRAGRTTA